MSLCPFFPFLSSGENIDKYNRVALFAGRRTIRIVNYHCFPFEGQSFISENVNMRKVFLIFASSRTMPGHIREFNRLKQHSSHDLVFKIWRNNNTEATFVSDCEFRQY